MVDAEIGVTDLDQNFARLLRNIDKPVYLVANKVDNHERLYEAQDFYRLGIKGDLFCISSVSGSGTGDLLDQVVSHFKRIRSKIPTTFRESRSSDVPMSENLLRSMP